MQLEEIVKKREEEKEIPIEEIEQPKQSREVEEIEIERQQLEAEKAEQLREEETAEREIEEADKELQIKENIRPEEIEPPREKENIAADQQSQIHEPEISEKRSEVVEEAKQRLNWNREYVNLDLEISEKNFMKGKTNTSIRKIEDASEDIYKMTRNIDHWKNEVEKLQEKKQGLNIFQGKEKKAIDARIEDLERPIKTVSENLERNYGIKPEQAQQKLEALKAERGALMKQMPSQAEIELLKDRQEKIALQYRISMQRLELRPDREQITELMKKFKTTRIMDSHEESKVAQAERKLNTFGKPELEKMLKFVPDKSDVSELIKDKITSIALSKVKSIHRGLER